MRQERALCIYNYGKACARAQVPMRVQKSVNNLINKRENNSKEFDASFLSSFPSSISHTGKQNHFNNYALGQWWGWEENQFQPIKKAVTFTSQDLLCSHCHNDGRIITVDANNTLAPVHPNRRINYEPRTKRIDWTNNTSLAKWLREAASSIMSCSWQTRSLRGDC